ncbi:MAG: DNA-processing protein DprA [Bdellovibrionota bacterium]
MKELEQKTLFIYCLRKKGSYLRALKETLKCRFNAIFSIETLSEILIELGLELPSEKSIQLIKQDLDKWLASGIRTISLNEENYPELLKQIADPPPILFYRSTLQMPVELPPMISIVGSRKAGPEGIEFAKYLGSELAKNGVCVVSGLALGIDACAHLGALESNLELPTIAVLGNGLDRIYPSSNRPISNRILQSGGILLSQFEPDEKPFPANFLNRNRVIAGLSIATIVVQAAKRSGSLATARYAVESGREVFAVPGLPSHKMYEGTNNMIKQGARLISSIDDVFDEFPELKTLRTSQSQPLSQLEQDLICLIHEKGQVSTDRLGKLIASSSELAIIMLELEEKGLVRKIPGNFYTLSARALDRG